MWKWLLIILNIDYQKIKNSSTTVALTSHVIDYNALNADDIGIKDFCGCPNRPVYIGKLWFITLLFFAKQQTVE